MTQSRYTEQRETNQDAEDDRKRAIDGDRQALKYSDLATQYVTYQKMTAVSWAGIGSINVCSRETSTVRVINTIE